MVPEHAWRAASDRRPASRAEGPRSGDRGRPQPAPGQVGDELNKLASNMALGRNFAGLHWRSDATESLRLGEEVAMRFLAEERFCFAEPFGGFSLIRFDGTRVTV